MDGVIEFNQIFISSDKQDVAFVWMKSYFPSHIESLSRSCCRCCASIVDFIVMYAMVSSANSRMVELRPTRILFI